MSSANVDRMQEKSLEARLRGIKILLVAPSLTIMGGQAVQADLLLRNFRKANVCIDLLPINPIPWGPFEYLTKIKYIRTLVVSIFYLMSLLRRIRRYDLIHIFSASYFSFILAPTPALIVAKFFGKKIILNYRSGEAEDHLSHASRLVFKIIRLADKIVVPSQYLVDIFAKFNLCAEYIYNISDFTQFKFRDRTKVVKRIIVARNLEPLYDVETSIRTFIIVRGKYPELEMTIVGAGSAEKQLKRLVKKKNLTDIKFTGRVERKQMPQLYDRADIFLNSSIIDNMPVAIIEAFYCGLPVVTTNAGGIPYMVTHGETGLMAPQRDHRQLAELLIRVIEDQELRQKLVAAGREAARLYSWDNVKYKWADIYRNLVRDE